ncbi:MAG: putative sugar nucleotidyl transferase [bacterium]
MRTILFEDAQWRRLLPLTALKSTLALRCGILPLWERADRALEGGLDGLACRHEAAAAWLIDLPSRPLNPGGTEPTLWLNARVIWTSERLDQARHLEPGRSLTGPRGEPLAAVAELEADTPDLGRRIEEATETMGEADWPVLGTWYDLLAHNPAAIIDDAVLLGLKTVPEVPAGVHRVGEYGLWMGEGAVIMPGSVLDTREGPIFLDEGAEVMANAFLQGPCYVGRDSLVRVGSVLYEGCSLGRRCKVGGELEAVLMQGFANKQHGGYLGNAVVGEWVNLGAGTSNSDLKNTYGPVSTTVDGRGEDTGMIHLGCCLGDHTKTGINSMLNTGTVTGIACNLYGSGFPPAWVPDFIWGQPGRYTLHLLDRAVETAGIVMARRDVEMNGAYEALMRGWYEATASDRESFLARPGNRPDPKR